MKENIGKRRKIMENSFNPPTDIPKMEQKGICIKMYLPLIIPQKIYLIRKKLKKSTSNLLFANMKRKNLLP